MVDHGHVEHEHDAYVDYDPHGWLQMHMGTLNMMPMSMLGIIPMVYYG